MATRVWPDPLSDVSSASRTAATGFLLVGNDDRRSAHLIAALRAPCRRFKDGNQAVAYLLGRGPFADRARYPLPQAILLDLDHPGIPAMEPVDRCLLPPALRFIPLIFLKNSFSIDDLRDAYARGAVSCVEFPRDAAAAERVAEGLRRYWLTCNLPPLKRSAR